MNDNYRARPPESPGPACAYFAPLLPLLGQERLKPDDAHRLRQHLPTCAYCQSELASYNQMDDLLVRHFGPAPRGPLSSADIRALTSPAYRPRTAPLDAPAAPAASHNHHAPRPAAPHRPTRPQPARRRGRVVPMLSALAAVLVIAAIGLALFASGGRFFTANSKTPVPTIALPAYTPGGNDLFEGLAMVSPNEGWIVGGAFTPTTSKPLILHYLNGRLYEVNYLALQGTNADTTTLTYVGMISASEGWAMGMYQVRSGCYTTLFLRYTSGRWTQASLPSGTILSSVALTSPTNGWAVGSHEDGCNLGIDAPSVLYHYDGTHWTPTAVPADTLSLHKVVMTSASNGWVIGTKTGSDPNPGLLLHYDGKTWSEVSIPDAGQVGIVAFDDIAMASATDGWLLGSILQSNATASISPYAAAGHKAVLFHFDGRQWQKAPTLVDSFPKLDGSSLALAPDGSGWLATSEPGNPTIFLTLHLSGGVWSQVENPLDLYPNQIVPLSADDAWAVSNDEKGTYLLHYHNGAWESVPLTPAPTPMPTSTPTLTPTGTAGTGACTSHSGPTGAADAPGATVTPVPVTSWATYTNTTYHYQLLYPTNWALDNLNCPDSAYLAFWNYNYLNWQGPGFPAGGIKIELYALDNPGGLTAMQFFQMEQQNTLSPTCPAYTTRDLQVDGHNAIEATCPGQNGDLYYIPDGASMLRIAQGNGLNAASDVLTRMIASLIFTN